MAPAHDVDWFPPCYRRDELPDLLAQIFDINPAVARVAAALPEHGDANAVATALGLSPHTVKAHCQQLTKALGTTSRVRLCAIVVAAVWRESLRGGGVDTVAFG
jgi:hypothetical protein